MDVTEFEKMTSSAGEVWTDERHASFLSCLEECFVRRVLGWDDEEEHLGFRRRRLPLDRYLPDSETESTRDVKHAKPQTGKPVREAPAPKAASVQDFRNSFLLESCDPINEGCKR